MVIVPELRMGFQGAPKVGTTTMYSWMYDMCLAAGRAGFMSIDPTPAVSRRVYFTQGQGSNLLVANTPEATAPFADHFKLTFVRDPIKRFVSMYRNRVVHHRELSSSANPAQKLSEHGLAFDPDINLLVTRLEEYLPLAHSVWHHSRAQMEFLGPDLSVYTRIVEVSQMQQALDELREFWRGLGLEAVARHEAPLVRKQTGGPKMGIEVLTPASFEKLLSFYETDYRQIPLLSRDTIRADYEKARAAHAISVPVSGTKAAPDADPPQPQPEQPQAQPVASSSYRLAVHRMDSTKVEVLQFEGHKGPQPCNQPLVLKGRCLLAADQPAGDHRLEVLKDGRQWPCIWSIASPGLAEEHPGNPNAKAARFKVTLPPVAAGETLELQLHDTCGSDAEPIARLTAQGAG